MRIGDKKRDGVLLREGNEGVRGFGIGYRVVCGGGVGAHQSPHSQQRAPKIPHDYAGYIDEFLAP